MLVTPTNSKHIQKMTDPQIETEEEAHERKSKLFDIALNLLTAKSMVFSIKNFIPITF